MNEGHCGVPGLERIRHADGRTHELSTEAQEVTGGGTLFTTHTPVPAGIDVFPPELDGQVLRAVLAREPGDVRRSSSPGAGCTARANTDEPFNMAMLALRFADFANGVSELHGQVSRKMWQSVWPGVPDGRDADRPRHQRRPHSSWISHDMAGLFDRYLGPAGGQNPARQEIWERVDQIPDAELWRTHERRRERLVAFARRRLRQQLSPAAAHRPARSRPPTRCSIPRR